MIPLLRKLSVLAASASVLVTLGFVQPASAAFDVNEAKSAMNGGSAHNTLTNVTTSITDYVKITRKVRFKDGTYHNHNYWVLHVSAQRCKSSGCYGDILHGTLRPRQGLPGSSPSLTAVNDDSDVNTPTAEDAVERGLVTSLCYPNTSACVIPWNWLNSNVNAVALKIRDNYVYPCVHGALVGFGGSALTNLSVKMLMDVGLMSRSALAAALVGPEGAAVITLTGCTSGIAVEGYNDILDMWRGQR